MCVSQHAAEIRICHFTTPGLFAGERQIAVQISALQYFYAWRMPAIRSVKPAPGINTDDSIFIMLYCSEPMSAEYRFRLFVSCIIPMIQQAEPASSEQVITEAGKICANC